MRAIRFGDRTTLFMEHDWEGVIRHNIGIMTSQIAVFETSDFENDLSAQAVDLAIEHTIEVPVLKEGEIEVSRVEIEVETRRRRSMEHALYGRNDHESRNAIKLRIPIDGDTGMFRVQPNRFTTSPPRAIIGDNHITLLILPRSDDPKEVRAEIDKEIASIKQYLGWQTECHDGLRDRMQTEAKQLLERRKNELDSADDLVSNLGFKVKE